MIYSVDALETRRAFNEAVRVVIGIDISDADPSAMLTEIGVDSLDLIEIGMLIEQQWETVIDSGNFDGVQTIGDVLEAVANSVKEKGAGAD